MFELADCLPSEIVNLNGEGPMTLGEAVRKVMVWRRDALIAQATNRDRKRQTEPLIFRRGGKKPPVLRLGDIQELAARPDFRASLRGA